MVRTFKKSFIALLLISLLIVTMTGLTLNVSASNGEVNSPTATPTEKFVVDFMPVQFAPEIWKGSDSASAIIGIKIGFGNFEKLLLNGEVVDSSNYTVTAATDGKTVITLKEEYLKTLADEEYRFVAIFSDVVLTNEHTAEEAGVILILNVDSQTTTSAKTSAVTPPAVTTPKAINIPETGNGNDTFIGNLTAIILLLAISGVAALTISTHKKNPTK